MKQDIEQRLKECLQRPYENSQRFLEDVIFLVFGEDNFESAGNLNVLRKRPELKPKADASGITSIHKVGDLLIDGAELGIFDVTLDYKKQLQRNRVEVQQIIRSIISTHSGAFIIFHYESGARWEWRFTFCHKGASNIDSTDAKRYTFLLGPGQSCRTAAENFAKIHDKIDKEGEFEMDDIIRAFDVEALSKEFFAKYKVRYGRFVGHVIGKEYVDKGEGKGEWKDKEGLSPSHLFHALGKDEKVVRDYIKKLLGRIVFLHFLQKKGWLGATDEDWTNGPQDFMRKLFEQATDEQKDNFLDGILEPLFVCLDTPFNRRQEFFDTTVEGLRNVRIPFLGGLFESNEEDKAESIFPSELFADLFKFLGEYNFTIDENDPNDAQVGVDPEMLGRIFENLLEDNKDKGAFYTPKEIVQYMCRESLIAYLQTKANDETENESIRQFVTTHDVSTLGGKESDLAMSISQSLKDVKICDPAIGSGAFPMGLLNELFLCRGFIEDFSNAAEIKKHIIQQNIYGVDIEKGAVDIARLRFWLSLITDAERPNVLPNMDYKIMQGNSLLEQYNIDGTQILTLDDIVEGSKKNVAAANNKSPLFKGQDILSDLSKKLNEYYSITDDVDKQRARENIDESVREFIRIKIGRTYHKTSQVLDRVQALDKLANTKLINQDFFLWHTWFHDVFEKGGFDIVIGNPPYIQLQKDSGYLSNLYKSCNFMTFDRMGDIYSLFYEHGNNLLRKGGVLCYITSNKWMRTSYGEKTRAYFKDVVNPRILIDFVRMKLFDDATVETNILLFTKGKYNEPTKCASLVELKKEQLSNLCRLINANSYSYMFNSSDFWTISDVAIGNLKAKIKNVGIQLRNWNLNIFRGVLTGFNDAFIISTEKKNEILNACQSEDERQRTQSIMRPVIRGRDTGVFLNKWAGLWIINVHNGLKSKKPSDSIPKIDINEYPTLKDYFDKYTVKLQKRADKGDTYYNLRNCAYLLDFDKPKIIWKRIGSILRFAYDEDRSMCLDSTCFATGEHVKFLCAILNSKIGHFLLQDSPKTGTGDLLVSVQAIEPIVVPFPTEKQKINIELLVDQILSAKKSDQLSDTSALEAQIDRLVYDLYGLTEEEIKIVEGEND